MMEEGEYFKWKTKYVVDRKPVGDHVVVRQEDGDITVDSDADVDSRLFSRLSEQDFTLEGWVVSGRFYATDVFCLSGSVRDDPWHERFSTLRNEFSWTPTVKPTRPLVVTTREEMDMAFDIYTHVPDSEGVFVWEYEDTYPVERKYIPMGDL